MLLRPILLLVFALLPALAVRAEIRVVDDLGDETVLQAPARRIISLAPNITESLFLLGVGERIVGADEFSDYPPAAQDILRVNNYAAANYELILSLKPDLVIAWYSGNGESVVQRLRQLGLPVFVIEPRRLEDIAKNLERLGRLTGTVDRAAQLTRDFEDRLDGLRRKVPRDSRVRVFYQIWNEPLITLNGRHLVSDVISLCGGVNVFADAGPLVPYVSMEAVIDANPEVIIASGSSAGRPPWLDMWLRWPMIDAVKNGRVDFVPPDLIQRHSLRIAEGAARVCQLLEQAEEAG